MLDRIAEWPPCTHQVALTQLHRNAGYALSCAAYATAAVVIHREAGCFVPQRTWLLRMPLVATFAAQLAKLRTVVLLIHGDERGYFFWLFVALIVAQGLLAVWAAALACPHAEALQAPWRSMDTEYEVRRWLSVLSVGPRFCIGAWSGLCMGWMDTGHVLSQGSAVAGAALQSMTTSVRGCSASAPAGAVYTVLPLFAG